MQFLLEPTHKASVFSLFSPRPDMFPNDSISNSDALIDSSVPSKMSVMSSAY